MRITTFAAFLLVVTVPVVSADSVDERAAREAKIDSFVLDGPLFLKDKSLPALRRLGKLKAESVEKAVNRHNPAQTDEFMTFKFDGLEIYGFVRPSQELAPILVTITNARWKVLNDLNVGAPSERVIKVLGQPDEKTENIMTYRGESEKVNFHVSKSKITKVEFIYYFD
jgi:hypothetical protein